MGVLVKSAIGVCVAFALMGCEPAPEAELAAAAAAPAKVASQADAARFSPYDFQWFPMYVGVDTGQRPVRLRGLDNANLKKALKLVDSSACGDFKDCGRKAGNKLNGNGNLGKTSKFTGLGASGVAALVDIANKTDVGADVKVWAKGQIQNNCLDENGVIQPARSGYSYFKQTKNLRICVVVRTTTETGGVKKSTFEYFEVHARNVGLEERCSVGSTEPRCAGADAGNVFPKAAIKTGLKIDEGKTRPVPGVQMNWKLYGWGDNIKVTRYGLIPDVAWTSGVAPTPVWNSGNIYSRWQGHGQLTNYLRKLFSENNDACVDMMFVNRPPEMLGGGERVVYCLGRCESPPILNTL